MKRYSTTAGLVALALGLGSTAAAEPTLELYIRDAKEVFEGDPVSTSLDPDGRVSLGLSEARIAEGSGRPALSVAYIAKSLFVGTAGALVRMRPGQKPEFTEVADGLVVTTVATDGKGAWVATGPEGKILRYEGGKTKPVYDPDATHVWALLPEKAGLLAATGVPGHVIRLRGKTTERLFESEETHLRAMIRHPKRGLVVGGGERGVVYQVKEKGRVRALYDSDFEEVTAFAQDPKSGDLFAAMISAKKEGPLDPTIWVGPVAGEEVDEDPPIKGSEVVRIRSDGEVERLWASKNEGALSLAYDPETGRLFIATGTGPKGHGRVYVVETRGRYRVRLLARLEPPMVTGLVRRPDGALLAATAPDGAVYQLGPGIRAKGEYLSVEQDLGRVAGVGRLWFDADVPSGASLSVQIRTGNTRKPDDTWSPWSNRVAKARGAAVEAPRGRYAQFRAELKANGTVGPVLRSMHASVRRSNLPPEIVEVFPLQPGIYLKPIPGENEQEKTLSLSNDALEDLRKRFPRRAPRLRVRAGYAPGELTVGWKATDPNRDQLLFSATLIDERGREVDLGEGLDVPFITIDSRAHPDGRYRARVEATDRPGNSPEEALTDARQSEVFIIDNTPPELKGITARRNGRSLVVKATAVDMASRLKWAEVSVDGGPWVLLPPADGLLDGFEEVFELTIDRPSALGASRSPPHTLRIRVEDTVGNRVSGGTVVN